MIPADSVELDSSPVTGASRITRTPISTPAPSNPQPTNPLEALISPSVPAVASSTNISAEPRPRAMASSSRVVSSESRRCEEPVAALRMERRLGPVARRVRPIPRPQAAPHHSKASAPSR